MLHFYTLQVPQAYRQQPQAATKVEQLWAYNYKRDTQKYTNNVVTWSWLSTAMWHDKNYSLTLYRWAF